MNNINLGKKLEQRTKKFAISIIVLATKLPNTPEGKIIRYQIVKSGTSIGANYREANRAVSTADFKHKISVCEKEASETQYWLEIIMEAKLLANKIVMNDYKECSELLALFTSIRKSKRIS